MRIKVYSGGFNLWLSADDTWNWAHREGAAWPGSTLSGNRLFVSFDSNGICELSVNGKDWYGESHELNALVADHVRGKLPADHVCRIHFPE